MNISHFPQNLRILRSLAGYTQEEISRSLNICRQTYSNYERARRFPSMDILLVLSSFFQVPVDLFFFPVEQEYLRDLLAFREFSSLSAASRAEVLRLIRSRQEPFS